MLFSLRALYAAGKMALRKQGLKIPFGSDDLAWYFALFVKISADVCLALIVGHLFAQVCFHQEIDTYLMKTVAPQNAALLVTYRPKVQEMIGAAERAKQHDAAEVIKLKGERDALRRQQIGKIRRAPQLRGQQFENAAAGRQITNATLTAFEAKTAAAESQAATSARAYDELLKNSGSTLKALTENDPAYVRPPNGLLARLGALRTISAQDAQVFRGEAAIESFGVFCELFLLVLSIARCPTHLSEELYYDYQKRSNARAARLASELRTIRSPTLSPKGAEDAPPLNDAATSEHAHAATTSAHSPPKRGRGRPRRSDLNDNSPPIARQTGEDRSLT